MSDHAPPSAHRAVFLSYAREDTAAARRIAEALRAAGVEVWFDQAELRGGDSWDARIRQQLKDCSLFLPIISARTQARGEGYFRLEWRLADQRTHLMGRAKPFVVPVCIDGTGDAEADVPESFLAVQWTRLPEGQADEAFGARVRQLLAAPSGPKASSRPAPRRPAGRRGWALAAAGGAAVALAGAALVHFRPGPGPTSEARRLALQAEELIAKVDSGAEDYATADGILKHAQELDPSDGEIWAISAELNGGFFSRGFDHAKSRQEASRSQSERAAKLAPDSTRAWLARGDYFRSGVDLNQAEACLRRALALAPPSGSLHSRIVFGLAGIAWAKGDREGSFRLYGESIDPGRPGSDALAHYNQFLSRFGDRRFAEADALVAAAMQEFPTPNFVCGRALSCLTWRGDPDLAAAMLEKIPEARRSETRTTVITVITHLLRRRPQDALDVLASVSADFLSDNYYSGPRGLLEGEAQAALGHTEAARLAWEQALAVCQKRAAENAPDFRETAAETMLLGWLGREAEARRLLAAAKEKWGESNRGWYIESRGYAALGDADRALPAIQRMLTTTDIAFPLTPALLRLDPVWDKLRSDPRFQALAQAEGKPPPH
ncbi:MAG: TIR domain-containing protein [Opitutales bacterium]